MSKHYIICKKCQTENLNTDYCSNCGEIVNIVLQRQLEQQKVQQERIAKELNQTPNKVEKAIQQLLTHPNPFIRVFVLIIHSVWIVMAAIAAGCAYVVSMLAA
ncbi:MAG: hypothetical protein LBI72_06610 [Flavobacteriaceae bacterium]|jgi:hypothetical protein|nr:hypothetical protein [Flavobacteriaceae bacterium]